MQVINESTPGGRIGSSIGSGISKTLDMLTSHKLEQVAHRNQLQKQAIQRQQESGALQGLGVPSHVSDAISNITDPNLKRTILSNLGSLGGQEQQQGANLFENPANKFKQQQIDISKQAEERKAIESQAKLGHLRAQTDLTKAKTGDIAAERALRQKNQQLRESIAKTDEQIANAKNDLEKQKLMLQKNKMERQILVNDTSSTKLEDRNRKAQEQEQRRIDAEFKPYRDSNAQRKIAAEEIVKSAAEMLDELKTGNVRSGVSGKYTPLWAPGSGESQRFSKSADDVASALTSLSKGQQGIGKIKFNQERKPTLADDSNTQLKRTQDLLQDGAKVLLETDIEDYLIKNNDYQTPKGLKTSISEIMKKVSKVPLKEPNDQDGDLLDDKKTGIQWVVSGPILRFNGLIGKA